MLRSRFGYMQTWEIYPLLGIKGSILPKEGFGERWVQNVKFKCDPAGEGGRRAPHRLKFYCFPCGKWIPFGRAGQHRKGREHQTNRDRMPEPGYSGY